MFDFNLTENKYCEKIKTKLFFTLHLINRRLLLWYVLISRAELITGDFWHDLA